MEIRKGATIMTNVLVNAENIIDTYEDRKEPEDRELSKIEIMLTYYKLKRVINDESAQRLVKKHIVKDKSINSGRVTIKGTRVTPEDIGRILLAKEDMGIEDIMKEYPTLESKEQVVAGLIYYMDKHISLMKILFNK